MRPEPITVDDDPYRDHTADELGDQGELDDDDEEEIPLSGKRKMLPIERLR